jgi:hypothetical protein
MAPKKAFRKPTKNQPKGSIDAKFKGCNPTSSIRCRFLKKAREIASRDPSNIGTPEEFLITYTPTQAKELMFGNTLTGPIRDVLENVSANNQCVQARIDFVPDVTRCWLCGCVIRTGEAKACEHIIPALRAIMFSGMITTRKIMKGIVEAADEAEELLERVTNNNYLWAHDNCNGSGAKGGMVLFKINDDPYADPDADKFIVDTTKCNDLQTKIRALGRDDCHNTEHEPPSSIYENLVTTIESR